MPNNAVYLYAITEPNTYTIYFDGNWSTSWNMSGMDMTYDKEKNLLKNLFIKDWFIFKWWSSTKTWTVEYLDQSEVKNLTAEDKGSITLYAQRGREIPYTINYYQQNIAWTWYDLVGTGIEYTTTESLIVLTGKIYTGFTLQTWSEISINPDWSTVVPYYYDRNTYNLTVKDRDNILINTWIKYWADIILPETLTWWTWNTFSWWDNVPDDGKMPANDIIITSVWTYGIHTITFDTNWWTEIEPITKNYWENIEIPENPTKEWYEFVWWSPELPTTMPYDDITVTAIWKEISKWTGWSGRWRTWWSPDTSEWDNQHNSADQTWNISDRSDLEVWAAYMWAYRKGIINSNRRNSDPDGYIPRWDMAEMVVKFSENVLWRKIPSEIPAKCNRWDAENEWRSVTSKIYAQKACALWVMWIRMENFMPKKLIDRAEFWTILSRLLWWTKYDVVDATATKLYYTRHLDALNKAWIMKQIENPTERKELRKRAWLMLMRVRE